MMSIRRRFGLATALVGLVVGLCGEAQSATSYDLAADFSTASNPNGPWTYGQYTGGIDPSTFSAYGNTITNAGGYTGLNGFGGTAIDPNVLKNTSGTDIDTTPALGDILFRAGQVVFGPANGPSVARFTTQTDGVYDISAIFQTVQQGNTAPTASIYEGLNPLFQSGPVSASPSTTTYSGTVVLTAGQTLDFIVGDGTKSTQVNATITAVPEPASVIMVSLAGLMIYGIRRRKAVTV